MKHELRALLLAGSLLAEGCTASPPTVTPMSTVSQENTHALPSMTAIPTADTSKLFGPAIGEVNTFTSESIRTRVNEILQGNYEWEKVYAGGQIEGVHQTVQLPVTIMPGFNKAAIGSYEINVEPSYYSAENRAVFIDANTQGESPLPTISRFDTAIYLSQEWYDLRTPDVQRLLLKKEAYNIIMFSKFASLYELPRYRDLGEYILIDPSVTDGELALVTAYTEMVNNPNMAKLYDFAGILSTLRDYEDLEKSSDPLIRDDLGHFNIYRDLKASALSLGVPFRTVELDSPEFYHLAFDDNSVWARFILDHVITYRDN